MSKEFVSSQISGVAKESVEYLMRNFSL